MNKLKHHYDYETVFPSSLTHNQRMSYRDDKAAVLKLFKLPRFDVVEEEEVIRPAEEENYGETILFNENNNLEEKEEEEPINQFNMEEEENLRNENYFLHDEADENKKFIQLSLFSYYEKIKTTDEETPYEEYDREKNYDSFKIMQIIETSLIPIYLKRMANNKPKDFNSFIYPPLPYDYYNHVDVVDIVGHVLPPLLPLTKIEFSKMISKLLIKLNVSQNKYIDVLNAFKKAIPFANLPLSVSNRIHRNENFSNIDKYIERNVPILEFDVCSAKDCKGVVYVGKYQSRLICPYCKQARLFRDCTKINAKILLQIVLIKEDLMKNCNIDQ